VSTPFTERSAVGASIRESRAIGRLLREAVDSSQAFDGVDDSETVMVTVSGGGAVHDVVIADE
jgi:hypothetical protein